MDSSLELLLILALIAGAIVNVYFSLKKVSAIISVYSALKTDSSSSSNPQEFTDALLQGLWKDRGILNTSLTLQQVCPGYFDSGQSECPKTAADCKGGVIDLSDYKAINNVIANHNNGIRCFSLATTLQNSRLAQMAFGPFPTGQGIDNVYLTGDTTVGVFLDLKPLQKYIGCLSLLDSGSVGRYGDSPARVAQALEITSERLASDYQAVLDDCASSDKCGFFMAGCAGSQGKQPFISQTGTGYNYVEEAYDPPTYKDSVTGAEWLPKGWLYLDSTNGTPGTVKFFPGTDKGLKAFETTLIKTQNIVGPQADSKQRVAGTRCQQTVMLNTFEPPQTPIPNPQVTAKNVCADYWSYQFQPVFLGWNNGDGFRENEVDIFVPQDKTLAQPDFNKPNMKCVPDQGFVDAFRDAVVGVYATKYCEKDVPFLLEQSQKSSKCCNYEISKSVAFALANKYNASPHIKHKINAWEWDVVDPVGKWSAPSNPDEERLNVTLITGKS